MLTILVALKMNTASRMESTGVPDRIQISQEMADLLLVAGKAHWCVPREDKVKVKGKGELSTYFLNMDIVHHSRNGSDAGSEIGAEMTGDQEATEKRNRIADWTVVVLACLLKDIEVRRKASKSNPDRRDRISELERTTGKRKDQSAINEIQEVIMLPEFDARAATKEENLNADDIVLDPEVFEQLRDYVQTIASLYSDENPFHNFAHASHVTMSVVKLLNRIVAPDADLNNQSLHDHTYGITGDPLTRFAVVFSALIHDVDHTGVPNAQLVKEKAPVAALYKDKSVAEQNSIDIAWEVRIYCLLLFKSHFRVRANTLLRMTASVGPSIQ